MDHKEVKAAPAKERILRALEELLQCGQLDDIHVSDLIRLAGVSRKTFYRHFQDKYDLVNCYFRRFYQDTFEQVTAGAQWDEALYRYLMICGEKAEVLRHAYSSHDANCLRKYDIEMTEKTYRNYLTLKGADVGAREMDFAVRIASCGGTDMVIGWLMSGMREEKEVIVSLIKRTLPGDILKYLQ